MIIEPIAASGMNIATQALNTSTTQPRVDFQSLLGTPLASLNQAMHTADATAVEFAVGGDMPIHDVMLSMEQARMSLQLAVEIRNRAVEAYQELMRMQL
jgi:flagellar hook-basal body complex protein FliE